MPLEAPVEAWPPTSRIPFGSPIETGVASPYPYPVGTKRIVCEFSVVHVPLVAGVTAGRELPSALATGFEKVRVIGVVGVIVVPAAGVATALAVEAPAGNQLTTAGLARSQRRSAASTVNVPAGGWWPRLMTLCGVASTCRCRWPGCPYATTATGCLKRSFSGCPWRTVMKWARRLALGVTTVMCSVCLEPVSHEIHPGRLTTTVIRRRSWAGISVCCGQIRGSPVTLTGMMPPFGPVTETLTILPPPSGSPTFASALESAASEALDDANLTAATDSAAITTSSAPTP